MLTSLLAVVLLCFVAAFRVSASASLDTRTTIDNALPRTDENGEIVNAHQGHITRFAQPDGSWRYYWIGSAWVPCVPPAGSSTCVDGSVPTAAGHCLEPKENGCLSMKYGACGFNNNNISIYSSATLGNAGWRVETNDALPRATRAVGEYWQPNFEYNPATKKYVLWVLYSAPNTTIGVVQTATSDNPAGPYTLVNRNVSLAYRSFTSANLFVDRPVNAGGGVSTVHPEAALTAYVIYSSFNAKPGMSPAAVVQRLDPSWTNTVSPVEASAQFGSGEGMVMLRVDPPSAPTVYYALVGTGCCFCPEGADLIAWTAAHPTGPWTQARPTSINPPWANPPQLLATGEIVLGGPPGNKMCLTANASATCIPQGKEVPGAGHNGTCMTTLSPCTGATAQQWRLTSLGEIQSALTPADNQGNLTCLDAARGVAGQPLYTNFCVRSPGDPRPVGQLWRWDTSGDATRLVLDSSATCLGVNLTMEECVGTGGQWHLPRSAPLPPPPPPPASDCHGCQVGSCCVPRIWELPTQQQGVTPVAQHLETPSPGCAGGFVMWSGDGWQQAPDDLKEHDPQWWVPLCFDDKGGIGNLSGVLRWDVL
eukprot:m.305806 g.305806  ORF g.305806 m.305806 type:complete len:593 (-) comp16342_c1_seq1:1424-3202(-)